MGFPIVPLWVYLLGVILEVRFVCC